MLITIAIKKKIIAPNGEPAATKPTIIIKSVNMKYNPNKRRIAIPFDFAPIIKTFLVYIMAISLPFKYSYCFLLNLRIISENRIGTFALRSSF